MYHHCHQQAYIAETRKHVWRLGWHRHSSRHSCCHAKCTLPACVQGRRPRHIRVEMVPCDGLLIVCNLRLVHFNGHAVCSGTGTDWCALQQRQSSEKGASDTCELGQRRPGRQPVSVQCTLCSSHASAPVVPCAAGDGTVGLHGHMPAHAFRAQQCVCGMQDCL